MLFNLNSNLFLFPEPYSSRQKINIIRYHVPTVSVGIKKTKIGILAKSEKSKFEKEGGMNGKKSYEGKMGVDVVSSNIVIDTSR